MPQLPQQGDNPRRLTTDQWLDPVGGDWRKQVAKLQLQVDGQAAQMSAHAEQLERLAHLVRELESRYSLEKSRIESSQGKGKGKAETTNDVWTLDGGLRRRQRGKGKGSK